MSKALERELKSIKARMERYANKQSEELFRAFAKSLREIRKEIGLIYGKYTVYTVVGELDITRKERVKALRTLERKLLGQARELARIEDNITTNILKNVGMDAGIRTAYAIEKGIDTVIDLKFLNPKTIEKVMSTKIDGKTFSDRIWTNKELVVKRVKRDIELALIKGEPISELTKQLQKNFGSSAFESRRLIHNEVKNVQIEVQEELYEQSEVVSRILWIATLDDRTRDDHQDYDGQTWAIDEPHPSPKDYVACRCTLAPVIEGWNPEKRRENTAGRKEIDYTSYSKWKESRNL